MKKRLFIGMLFLTGTSLLQSLWAASFDCNIAKTADEKAVCSSRGLSELDVEMQVKYHFLTGLMAMGAGGEMQDSQAAWLTRRQRCGADISCLNTAYRQRISELNRLYDAINKPL